MTEIGGGLYYYTASAGEVDTTGPVSLRIAKSGVAPAVFYAQVIDNDINGSLKANVLAIDGDVTAAARHALAAATIYAGIVDDATAAPSTTAFEVSDFQEQTADHFAGCVMIWTTGALTGQRCSVTGYAWTANSKGQFTVSTLTEAPADGDTFILV
jgi:hypothetical protein